MEGGSPAKDLISASASAAAATAAAGPPAVAASAEPRQRFAVELRPGDTTIVSWKKLLKESGKASALPSAPAAPAPEIEALAAGADVAAQAGEGELKDVAPQNRFSAVIEKIERLYMGKHSSDEEELDDAPDDDEYDTEDSFIDDAELDEYFQVENSATKHSGYFVNKGKLERIEPVLSPELLQPKKRKRREKNDEQLDPTLVGNLRIKDAARKVPLARKKPIIPSTVKVPMDEHLQEGKHLKDKNSSSTAAYKNKSVHLNMDPQNAADVKASRKDASSFPVATKDFKKQKSSNFSSRDLSHKSRGTVELFDAMYQAQRDRVISSQVDSRSKKSLNGESEIEASVKVRRKEQNGTNELIDLNSSVNMNPLQTPHSSARLREGSSGRPKSTRLERAFHELEKIVALCGPLEIDVQETDPSNQSAKKRLPQEVKHKLAKVASLTASQNNLSEKDILDRLMGILGHLVNRKTLKRHMKQIVELGLSAKEQKDDRFQKIKKDVNDMIRTRVALLNTKVSEHQDGSADDFQEVHVDGSRSLKGDFSLDKELEDKICELYDLYIEGMVEDKGTQSRKLYVELSELWPHGYMDINGIKRAILRSKNRKRSLHHRNKAREEETIKRKRLATNDITVSPDMHDTSPAAQAISNQPLAASGRVADMVPPNEPVHHVGAKRSDKALGGSGAIVAADDGIKKKMKRRPESDHLADVHHPRPPKLPQHDAKENAKPLPPRSAEEGDSAQLSKSGMSGPPVLPPLGLNPPSGS